MKESRVILSKRLQMLGNMVTVGNSAADVGCDHGFLSIWLVQAGVSSRVLAMDVRKGPLAAAKKHVEAYGLGDYIETRLSDGLQGCEAGEAETVICAGMGGRLMERILTEGMEKVTTLKELILQPQSELWEFRVFLRRAGFAVMQEDAVWEDGKYYFAMKVRPPALWAGKYPAGQESFGASEGDGLPQEEKDAVSQEQRVRDRFGEKLLSQKNPVLLQYLRRRRESLAELADTLGEGESEKRQARLQEILFELSDVDYALSLYTADGTE